MTKVQMIDAMAEQTGLSKRDCERAYTSFLECACAAIQAEGTLNLPGFGSFTVRHKEAREGRNPQTGEVLKISAKNVVKFKAAKPLNDRINQ